MKKKYTGDRLVAFLYLILRDEVTAGKLESIMNGLEDQNGHFLMANNAFSMSNGYLANHAEDIAKRLVKKINRA